MSEKLSVEHVTQSPSQRGKVLLELINATAVARKTSTFHTQSPTGELITYTIPKTPLGPPPLKRPPYTFPDRLLLPVDLDV